MNDTTTITEAARLREQALKQRQAAQESFDRCDTDGFLSQWAHQICATRDELQAQVVEQGGTSVFPALFDLEGNLVAAKLISIKSRFHHGSDTMWGILSSDDPHSQIKQWIKAFPARATTLEKKGYREGSVRASAKAAIVGEKTACAVILRTDDGFSRTVTVISNGKE